MLYAIPVDFGKFFRFFVFVLTNFSIKNKEFVTEYAFSKINICQYIPPSKLQNAKMNVNLIFGEDNVNSMMKTRTCKGSALTYFLTNSLTTQPIVTSINQMGFPPKFFLQHQGILMGRGFQVKIQCLLFGPPKKGASLRDKIEMSREDKEEKNNRPKKVLNYFYFKLSQVAFILVKWLP